MVVAEVVEVLPSGFCPADDVCCKNPIHPFSLMGLLLGVKSSKGDGD